jgi:hypothetical protein
LRAGVPTIVIPHIFDQFFWSQLVSKIGVGPEAPSIEEFNENNFAEAILKAISDEKFKKKAAEIGEKIRMEDGVVATIDLMEELIKTKPQQWSKKEKGWTGSIPWIEDGRAAPSNANDWIWMYEKGYTYYTPEEVRKYSTN